MSQYLVSWSIDIEADSAQEAAEKAQQDYFLPGHWATVFEVLDDSEDKHTFMIDLPTRPPLPFEKEGTDPDGNDFVLNDSVWLRVSENEVLYINTTAKTIELHDVDDPDGDCLEGGIEW